MNQDQPHIFVVDDEQSMCQMLTVVLEKAGYQVSSSCDPQVALTQIITGNYDLVIQDLKMPTLSGIELLSEIKKAHPDALVIVMTAFSAWDVAVEAMRLGAYDYIKKPFDNEVIKATVAKAIEQKRLYENYTEHGGTFKPIPMIGSSQAIKGVAKLIRQVAKTDSTVLISGESGTGKEVAARSLHASSLRAYEPFISINCGALTETLLESELFGHVAGAFTGAIKDKKGLIELAHGGTIFLDEIGEMTLATQVKFLKVLEDRQFYPVGGTTPVIVDVRIVAATNKNLEDEIQQRNFREDLYYRLNVIPLILPPLRERKEDIPLLAGHFLAEYSKKVNHNVKSFSSTAIDDLYRSDWRGNIRELGNAIHRAVALCDSSIIEHIEIKKSLTPSLNPSLEHYGIPADGIHLEKKIEEIEKAYICEALKQSNQHMTNAAKLLNMSFRSFRYKVKKYRIDVN